MSLITRFEDIQAWQGGAQTGEDDLRTYKFRFIRQGFWTA